MPIQIRPDPGDTMCMSSTRATRIAAAALMLLASFGSLAEETPPPAAPISREATQ